MPPLLARSRSQRRLLVIAAPVALLWAPGASAQTAAAFSAQSAPGADSGADLDSRAEFERARIYYESASYGRCVVAFQELLEGGGAGLAPADRTAARTYLAACLVAQGEVAQAQQQFREAILEDRQMEPPDPVVFPQAVVDIFLQVRSSLMNALRRQQEEELRRSQLEAEQQQRVAELERLRVIELERLAGLESVIRKNERWMAWVPFGVGQFQNESDTLGWIFLTVEAGLTVTAITATSIELGLHARAQGGRSDLDPEDLTSALDAANKVATASWLSLTGVVALGILEANLSFRPEISLGARPRPLPESLQPSQRSPQREAPEGGDSRRGDFRVPVSPSGQLTLRPVLSFGYVGVSGTF